MCSKLESNTIRTNCLVTEISTENDSVTVKTQKGNEFKGKHVLITASIGVLKSETLKFVPALPEWKKKAFSFV